MPDPQPNHDKAMSDKTLSEISHLFLSSVRDRQTQGAARPVRRPPGQAGPDPVQPRAEAPDIDLTPEEFEHVIGGPELAPAEPTHVPVAALLAGHLGARQVERAREYAASQAAGGARVGLIEVDAAEFRLWLFEPSNRLDAAAATEAEAAESLDARRMSEALTELAHDVDQWLVLLPSPRATEARSLLRELERWVLITPGDHDGIVAGYRTLKGLSESHQRNDADAPMPRLSLAVLDARDGAEASRVFAKLASVCRQFLHWPIESEPLVTRATGVAEHLVLACRGSRDKAQLAAAPQWQVVLDFVRHLKTITVEPTEHAQPDPGERPVEPAAPDVRAAAQDFIAHQPERAADTEPASAPAFHPSPEPAPRLAAPLAIDTGESDVIDLPAGDCAPDAIASAVLRGGGGGDLVECSVVRPPMCAHATLAVSRDRCLVLVAVARQGLGDLRAIGQAYRWLIENRPLIALAVPQFAIDAHQLPRLRLLVDHADASADVLAPILQSGHVTVHAYRKLRWGTKTGLLLEAA